MGSTRRLFLIAAVTLGTQVSGRAFALDDPPD
jgi:hypothetical protein